MFTKTLVLASLLAMSNLSLALDEVPTPTPAVALAPLGAEEPTLVDPKFGRAFLGIGYREQKLTSEPDLKSAFLVTLVIRNSAAEQAGLRSGDLILSFDGWKVDSIKAGERIKNFSDYIKSKKVGSQLALDVLRTSMLITDLDKPAQSFPSEGALLEGIAKLPTNKDLKVNIRRQSTRLEIVAILGQRRTISAESLDEELQHSKWIDAVSKPVAELAGRFYQQFGFMEKYEDLLARYRQNELWDDGQRLSLFRYLHVNPLKTQATVERLAMMVAGENPPPPARTGQLLDIAGFVLDLPMPGDAAMPSGVFVIKEDQMSATKRITEVLAAAMKLRDEAFDALDEHEVGFLYREASGLLERFSRSLYIDDSAKPEQYQRNTKIIDIAKRVKLEKLVAAAQVMHLLSDRVWLGKLQAELPVTPTALRVAGVSGSVLASFDSPAGRVVVGGFERNIYEGDFAFILDLGGDDYYRGKSAGTSRKQPLSLVVDLAGDDEYNHTEIASQGSGLLGVGMLYDYAGDDFYAAVRLAQGASFLGVGVLHDRQGNDHFISEDLSQGVAFWGVGMLLEGGGDDRYQSNLYAQGVGAVKGFGLLLDAFGDDDYLATGRELSSYGTSGVFKGLSQGVGVGFRGYASGGVGMVLDGAGDDQFRAGNFSQGVGYFYGLGILVNAGNGDDFYLASRYGQGASAHSATGVLLEEGGDDRYFGLQWALQGFAWDLGSAWLIDKQGDDFYNRTPHSHSLASADHNGFAVLVDYEGRDNYAGYPSSVGNNTYQGGHSFALFVDAGGQDDVYRPDGANSTVTTSVNYGVRADLPCSIESVMAGDKIQCQVLRLIPSTPR